MSSPADSAIACPLCNAPMALARPAGDHASHHGCAACDVWWFDTNQLRSYLSTQLAPYPSSSLPGEGGGRLAPRQRQLACPRCGGSRLRSFQFRTFDFEHCPQCRGTLGRREGVRALADERLERKSATGGAVKDAISGGYAGIHAGLNWIHHQAGAVVPPDADGTVELRVTSFYKFFGWFATAAGALIVASYWLVDWDASTRLYQVVLFALPGLITGMLCLIHWRRTWIRLSPAGFVQERGLGSRRTLRWDEVRDLSVSWWNLSPALVLHGKRGEKMRFSYAYIGFITFVDYVTPYARTDRARRAIDTMRRMLDGRAP